MIRRIARKYSDDPKGYKEEYMNKAIDIKDLDEVNGGFGEYLPDIQEIIKQQEEERKNAGTNPNAKKEQGDYKKIR